MSYDHVTFINSPNSWPELSSDSLITWLQYPFCPSLKKYFVCLFVRVFEDMRDMTFSFRPNVEEGKFVWQERRKKSLMLNEVGEKDCSENSITYAYYAYRAYYAYPFFMKTR